MLKSSTKTQNQKTSSSHVSVRVFSKGESMIKDPEMYMDCKYSSCLQQKSFWLSTCEDRTESDQPDGRSNKQPKIQNKSQILKNPWRHFTCWAIHMSKINIHMNTKPLWSSMNDDWGLSEQEFIYHVKRLLCPHNVTIFIYGSSGKVPPKLTISNSQCFTKTKQKRPFGTETRPGRTPPLLTRQSDSIP